MTQRDAITTNYFFEDSGCKARGNDPINILLANTHQKLRKIVNRTTINGRPGLTTNRKASKRSQCSLYDSERLASEQHNEEINGNDNFDFKFIKSIQSKHERKKNSIVIGINSESKKGMNNRNKSTEKFYIDLSYDESEDEDKQTVLREVSALPSRKRKRNKTKHEPVFRNLRNSKRRVNHRGKDVDNSEVIQLNYDNISDIIGDQSDNEIRNHIITKIISNSQEKFQNYDSVDKENTNGSQRISPIGILSDEVNNDDVRSEVKKYIKERQTKSKKTANKEKSAKFSHKHNNNIVKRYLRSSSKQSNFLNTTETRNVIDLSMDIDDDNDEKKLQSGKNKSLKIIRKCREESSPDSSLLNAGIQDDEDKLDDVICLSSDSEDYDYIKVRNFIAKDILHKSPLQEEANHKEPTQQEIKEEHGLLLNEIEIPKTYNISENKIKVSNDDIGKLCNSDSNGLYRFSDELIARHELLCGSIHEKPVLNTTFLQQYHNFKPKCNLGIDSPPASPPSSVDFTVSEVYTGVTLANTCSQHHQYEKHRSCIENRTASDSDDGENKNEQVCCSCSIVQEMDDCDTLNSNGFNAVNNEFSCWNPYNNTNYIPFPYQIFQNNFNNYDLNNENNQNNGIYKQNFPAAYIPSNSFNETIHVNSMISIDKNKKNNYVANKNIDNWKFEDNFRKEQLRCGECQMMYNPKNNKDKTLHKEYHEKSVNGMIWKSEWAKPNYSSMSSKISGAFFDMHKIDKNNMMQRDGLLREVDLSKKNALKMICGFLEMINKELGDAPEDWLTEAYRKVKETSSNITSNVLKNSVTSLGKVFVFIFRNRIVGLVSFEKISSEHRKNNRVNKIMDVRTEEVFELSGNDSDQYDFEGGLDLKNLPEVYGVSRVFVLKKYRRQGVGLMMLNSAVHKLVYGRRLSRFEICWSQTSFSGMKLAKSFNLIRSEKNKKMYLRVYI